MQIINNKQILLQSFSRGYGFYLLRMIHPDKMINAINCKKCIRLFILKSNWVFFHYAVGIFTHLLELSQRKNTTGCWYRMQISRDATIGYNHIFYNMKYVNSAKMISIQCCERKLFANAVTLSYT